MSADGTSADRAEADFIRLVQRTIVWEDLLNPVQSIAGYAELVLEESSREALGDTLPYLDRIEAASLALSRLVVALQSGEIALGSDGVVSAEAKLRHDLRTPLNALIGYGEMALEDLADAGTTGNVIEDLDGLLHHSRHLLSRLDVIIDASRTGEPASAAAPSVASALLRTVSPVATAAQRGETGRILVVDDNEANRTLLVRRLRQQGHEVIEVASGRDALDELARGEVDLVLLDVLMPEMNGLEVLQHLKADERLYGIPVIMISGLNENETVLRCLELGADDYLPKPCDVVLLRARINASLERTRWRSREREILEKLRLEKQRSEALLHNILPGPVVARLNAGETVIADRFENASILFADIVGFTAAAAQMSASRIVAELDQLFTAFDAKAAQLGVEKIKTIGDAYMAASGLPDAHDEHAERLADFAVGLLDALDEFNAARHTPLALRIGMHCGPVVAGVIGRSKFIYDVWGDTVNIASRLESHGVPGRIQVSEDMMQLLQHRFAFEPRGTISLKGRGDSAAFLLLR